MAQLELKEARYKEFYGEEDVYEVAKNLGGLQVIEGHSRHLQVDLDEPQSVKAMDALEMLRRDTPLVHSVLETTSRNGNRHLYIKLNEPLMFETRVALQAILGSDPKREVLALLRNGRRHPELAMFETPAEYERVREFLEREPEAA